jgi:hypothetical protein
MWSGMVLMAGAIAERAEERCPSKAYRPYFEARGFPPLVARAIGSLTISIGQRQADEAKTEAKVIAAIRFFARGRGQKRAVAWRARLVLEARDNTSIVDTLFVNARVDECEVLRLLQTVIDGGAIDSERIQTLAAASIPRRPRARGRKIKAASAAHELFLANNAQFGFPAGYTWSDGKEDFVDHQTRATMQEFDDPRFDPRPAYRRTKRRGLAETDKSR